MNRKTQSTILLLFVLFVSACTSQGSTPSEAGDPSKTVTVMAAASLTAAFEEIGAQFENQNAGVKVQYNFAGSQQLAQQIGQGAPADVFASANKSQMDVVVKSGQVAEDAPQVFVQNRLVVIFPKENPGAITRLQDLAKAGLKIVLAAKEVPVGQYTLDFLDKASQDPAFGHAYKDDVIKNVVSYEENVKAVLAKISLGEADAGIVYTTDAASAAPTTIGMVEIADTYNVIASYPIALINDSQNPELAKAYIDLVLSPAGQETLKKYGFISPEN